MSENHPPLSIPESTFSYLIDPVIRKAVDSLLDEPDDALPSSLDIAELANYFRAKAAAVAVKYDTVIVLEELWRTIWADAVVGWRCHGTWKDEVDPNSVWQGSEFWVSHNLGKHKFWSAVALELETGTQKPCVRLYCSLTDEEEEEELFDGHLDAFELTADDDEWDGWMKLKVALPIFAEGCLDITGLQEAARQVGIAMRQQTS
ncbi:hypothetical protein [Sphingobium yanoikuyae]|uniref:hypothetical protein n=1 Tax=Sphingobium yanoikuyae TaxID=13690 RepID=UPI0035B24F09